MFPQWTQWTMDVRLQIDFLKVHIHFCWILRNSLGISFLTGEKTLMSLSLFLCMSFHSTAKADNLISNIIVHYMKVIFFCCPFFIYILFITHCSHADTHMRNTHIFPLISQLFWSGLFWIHPTSLFVSLWLWIGILLDRPLSEQNYSPKSYRELSIEGLYFNHCIYRYAAL